MKAVNSHFPTEQIQIARTFEINRHPIRTGQRGTVFFDFVVVVGHSVCPGQRVVDAVRSCVSDALELSVGWGGWKYGEKYRKLQKRAVVCSVG